VEAFQKNHSRLNVAPTQRDAPFSKPIQQELLRVLEFARSRLAVAVAASAKRIPPAGWRRYFEIDGRARRCARNLRHRSDPPGAVGDSQQQALASLQRFNRTAESDITQLCRALGRTLSLLESRED
jgi:hypothetical protein